MRRTFREPCGCTWRRDQREREAAQIDAEPEARRDDPVRSDRRVLAREHNACARQGREWPL